MMRKSWKNALCVALSLLLTTGTFGLTACGSDDDEKIDDSKLQLYIGAYDSGFGDEFLYEYKKEFEEIYKDYESEGGKKGVQVVISTEKNYDFSSLSNSIAGWNRDIYYTAHGNEYNRLAKQGAFLEITDIATETLQEENTSIADKMNPSYRDWFNIGGKYYALPQFEGGSGITYDVDYFNDNNLFINKNYENDSNLENKFSCKNNAASIAYGPDGVPGTFDDGLPATYEDFYDLCDRIVECGDTPVLWPGKYQAYMSSSLISVYTAYEGKENLTAHYVFSGEMDVVESFDGAGNPVIVKREITSANRADVFKQPGIYYALDFLNKIISNQDYYVRNDCFGDVDHLGAQQKFYSNWKVGKAVAMLFEGPWWYNEAKGARQKFNEKFPGQEHHYAMMPLPKGPNATNIVFSDSVTSLSFINAKIDSKKIDIAKKFLQFSLTNKALSTFTRLTSTTCPYTYTMSAEDLQNTSDFGKKMYDLHNSVEYFMPLNQSETFIKNVGITSPEGFWHTAMANENVPSNYFNAAKYSGKTGNTPVSYFNSISEYYSTHLN